MRASRWMLTVLAALTATVAAAQPAPLGPARKLAAPATASPVAGAAALTRPDVEAWLDGFMPYALQRADVAGAVVVVVKDGQPLLVKGYGYSDVARRTPVSPDATLFRPGSVSKLFTWTAVMQLVGEGRIDLDRDINAYLDFRIPPRPDGPITMRRLTTHTPGFEEAVKGLINFDPKKIEPLDATLKHWVPERVYAAGSTPAYSNYGAALAGYIVQRVSGEPFNVYLERHVFGPSGMTRSSMRQPLPPALLALMSKGYETASSPAKPYEFINASPAGALASSGDDMARFMIAHLRDERGAGILLKPETAQLMHHTYAPGVGPLNRMALGFYESNLNGHRIISHGGDTQWFHSDLNLFLDDDVGLFISMNSIGKDGASQMVRLTLLEAFADRYFPGPKASGQVPPATARAHARMIAGVYDNSRRSHSNFISAVNLVSQAKVVANPDGTITIPAFSGLNAEPRKWREIAPFVWRDVSGPLRVAAVVKDGRVARFSMDELSPFMVFEPSPWWRSSAWLLPALVAGLAGLALTVVLWPVAALARRRYGAGFRLAGADAQAYRLARIGALATVLVAAGWVAIIGLGMTQLDLLSGALDPWLAVIGVAGPLLLLAALAATLWNAWRVWRRTGWRAWFARLWCLVLVAGVGLTLWTAAVFHLFGLNKHY